jgi:hypothetical protein
MIAVVAVLLTQSEVTHVTIPTAARSRPGLVVAHELLSIANAKRRSRPDARMASANMKLPMKRKMTGSPYELNTSRAEPTPNMTAVSEDSMAITATGNASVIQSTIAHV